VFQAGLTRLFIPYKKAWKARHFIMRVLKRENAIRKFSLHDTSAFNSRISCWDLEREGQINVFDCVQKKAVKFANHTNDSGWEPLAQRRKIARICAFF
jgi:hypothetical protein